MSNSAPTSTPAAADRGGVQVIRRAAQILNALRDCPEGMSLSDIAEITGLARSTVHRIVVALEAELLVSAAPTSGAGGGYRLGSGIASLAQSAERSFALDFHPHMAKLSRATGETVDLSIREYDHVRFVHQISVPHRLRAVSAVGAAFPTYCTAPGKALLATLPTDQLERMLPREFEPATPQSLTSLAQLLEELNVVRSSGLAFDREEHTIGICAVGIAVEDSSGREIAISIPLPATRFYGQEQRLATALLAMKKEITAALA
jgi:DNA-binding IclR family transcriptional regulator